MKIPDELLATTEQGPRADHVDALRAFLDANRRLFVLTGAGISTHSGIPDYRDRDGGWKGGRAGSGRCCGRQKATGNAITTVSRRAVWPLGAPDQREEPEGQYERSQDSCRSHAWSARIGHIQPRKQCLSGRPHSVTSRIEKIWTATRRSQANVPEDGRPVGLRNSY